MNNYSPFGVQLTGRNFTASGAKDFRYGFNDMEKDDEIKGGGNSYDYGARFYDSRLGRFLSIDNYTKKFPFQSPYVFAGNTVIQAKDNQGDSIFIVMMVKVGDVTKQQIIKAEKIEDLYSIIGIELLYQTEMGKAEIDTYLNSPTTDIYVALSTSDLERPSDLSRAQAGTIYVAKGTKQAGGFDHNIINDDLRIHYEVFDGITLDSDVEGAAFVVFDQGSIQRIENESTGKYDESYAHDYDSPFTQAKYGRIIFHEFRAHLTYRLQGLIGGKGQHEKYGEMYEEDNPAQGTDAALIIQQLNEAKEKNEAKQNESEDEK